MDELCRRLAKDVDEAFPDLVAARRDDVSSGLRRVHGDAAEDLTRRR